MSEFFALWVLKPIGEFLGAIALVIGFMLFFLLIVLLAVAYDWCAKQIRRVIGLFKKPA